MILDSILSISADIETIGEILKKIIPTLEEVSVYNVQEYLSEQLISDEFSASIPPIKIIEAHPSLSCGCKQELRVPCTSEVYVQ